ncbi:MAG: uroporphyrinogen decarboxylase family protein [Oliverpabstia sp.]
MIECGFDAVNPVQCSAEGMNPQKVLPFGTPEEVREQVLQRLEIFSKDGGYICGTIHNIQAKTPIKNIIAMVDAIKEFNGDK